MAEEGTSLLSQLSGSGYGSQLSQDHATNGTQTVQPAISGSQDPDNTVSLQDHCYNKCCDKFKSIVGRFKRLKTGFKGGLIAICICEKGILILYRIFYIL